jgi:hypothetical protein
MPGGKLTIYTLGQKGVDVDTDPVLMADESLRLAQNAEHRQIAGRRGGLSNRDGYAQFTTRPMAGAVLGGIEMPIAATGGAPASGGGGNNTGSPIPGITSTNLGPGLTINPSTVSTPAEAPSVPFGQSGVLFGGSRMIIIGLEGSTIGLQTGEGWYLTSKGFANDALRIITGVGGAIVGPPGFSCADNDLATNEQPVLTGQMAYTYANGVLFYPEGRVSTASAAPNKARLRRYDGHVDSIVAEIPYNQKLVDLGAQFRTSIATTLVKYGDGNVLYVAVVDHATTVVAGSHGRVLRVSGLDAQSYIVTEVFNTLNTNNTAALNSSAANPVVPYIIENFLGNVWVGTWRGAIGFDPYFFMLQPDGGGPDGFSISHPVSADHVTTSHADVTVMKQFLGSLYVGYRSLDDAGNLQMSSLYKYDPDGTITNVLTPAGVASTKNAFQSLVVFKDALYASFYNPSAVSRIYTSVDGIVWSIVYSDATASRVPFNLGVDDGVIYAFGSKVGSRNTFLSSTDGASWTDGSAHVNAAGSQATNFPLNIFYGVNQ